MSLASFVFPGAYPVSPLAILINGGLNKELSGGGAMMDIGIYSVNGARYMIGEDPVWVSAQEVKTDTEKFKEGVDETITFQLGFPSGAVASCLSTYTMNNLDRFFLNGAKGYAEMQPSTGYGPILGRTHKGELNLSACYTPDLSNGRNGGNHT